jgi:hypothetical protein
MGMIEADHIQTLSRREFLASQQFLRPDQKSVSLCSFFASVRNRVCFCANLDPVLCKKSQQESAALIRIITLSVSVNLLPLLSCKKNHITRLTEIAFSAIA